MQLRQKRTRIDIDIQTFAKRKSFTLCYKYLLQYWMNSNAKTMKWFDFRFQIFMVSEIADIDVDWCVWILARPN